MKNEHGRRIVLSAEGVKEVVDELGFNRASALLTELDASPLTLGEYVASWVERGLKT
jgi:hypothetical protein